MSVRHSNISIFVPHLGCAHKCSFCNQFSITGNGVSPSKEDIDEAVVLAKRNPHYNSKTTEIAFFGGSFTAIETDYMVDLLKSAYKYVKNGDVCGIRVSTRPDAISEEILEILKKYRVTSIELGAQSMDDRVLKLNNRGHSSADVYKASKLIKEFGFSLGLQMMTGLYGSDNQTDIRTAESFIEIHPDTVRIYPTIVLKGTFLEGLVKNNLYKPQTLENAAELCAQLLTMFDDNFVKVIRIGLHSINDDDFVAGPWHPAFSEICFSKVFLKKSLSYFHEKGKYKVFVSPADISKMVGQKRSNIVKLEKMGFKIRVIGEPCVKAGDIKVIKDV